MLVDSHVGHKRRKITEVYADKRKMIDTELTDLQRDHKSLEQTSERQASLIRRQIDIRKEKRQALLKDFEKVVDYSDMSHI